MTAGGERPNGCWSSGAPAGRRRARKRGRRVMTRAQAAGRRRARGNGRTGHRNSGRWFPWWRNSARGWRCCARVPVPSACAARPGISAGKAPWRQRSSMPSPAAASPAGWVSPTAFSPRASRPSTPARHGQDARPAPAASPVSPAHSGAATLVAPGRARAFLAPFPVSVLDGPGAADLAALLPRLGIGTLGEFASLPAAEVVNRFGVPGVIAHRLARGLDPRPLAPRPPSADLSVSAEFDPPARQAEPVVFAAKALAERMHDGLAAGGLACVRVQVQAVWEDGRQITRLWRHDGLLSALAVAERVRWQLAAWQPGQPRPPPCLLPPSPANRQRFRSLPPGGGRTNHRWLPGRDRAAAADPRSAGPRPGPAARPVGRCGGHRPGGPGRRPRAGHARA